MKRYLKKRLSIYLTVELVFFVFVLFVPEVFSVDIDQQLEQEIHSHGFADVIVFVTATYSPETEVLLQQHNFLPGQDINVLKKILHEKKRIIAKQQQKALREMDIRKVTPEENEDLSSTLLESEDIDFVLEEKYSYINAFTGKITEEGYEKLQRDPFVLAVVRNDPITLALDTAVPFIGKDFVENISINKTAINGSGIGICIIDTGVDTTHPDISHAIVDQYCYCSQSNGCCPNNKSEDSSADDDNGHGTAVIGAIVSGDSMYSGIAPGAQIMAIKAFSSSGSGSTADVLSGINKCLEKAAEHNIKIFSFSFGGTTYTEICDSDVLATVANDLVRLGFFVAAASGNSGDSTGITSPSCGSNVTAVGSIYDNSSTTPDTVASFSNVNSVLDILAPGVSICTAKAQKAGGSSCYTSNSGGDYKSYSGTSFSAPIVAGAVALIAQFEQMEQNTIIEPLTISSILTATGESVLDPRNGIIFPRLNIAAALKTLDSTAPTITFIAPTPEENVPFENSTATIAVSVYDDINDIVLCTLTFNETNSTMNKTGSGREVVCSLEKNISEIVNYSVSAMDSQGNIQTTEKRVLFMIEEKSAATSVILTPDPPYRTTDINCYYIYSDQNNSIVLSEQTEIYWYMNTTTQENYTNNSFVPRSDLVVGDKWQCAIIPSDGTNKGQLTYSQEVIVANYLPSIFITGERTVQETEPVILNITYYDEENDNVIISFNDSRFEQIDNSVYIMNTTLSSATNFTIYVNATDGYNITTWTQEIVILDAVDSDSDGTPDFRDEDDDNDQIIDALDPVLGNISPLNLSEIHILINGTENSSLNETVSGLLPVAFVMDNQTLVEFFFNFSERNFSLFGVEISNNSGTNGNLFIRNLAFVSNKTAYIPDINSTASAVCIQDVADPSLETISSSCNQTNETIVFCNGTTSNQYSCTLTDGYYKVTGLQHSGVIEWCVDSDADNYGTGCSAGEDCNDASASVHSGAAEITDNGIDEDCNGSDFVTTVSEEEIVEEETTAAGAGGGGSGGGPNIFDQEDSAATADSSEEDTLSKQDANSEKEEAPKETTEKSVSQEQTAMSFSPEARGVPQQVSGLFAITGAAITDIKAGKLTTASIIFLLIFLFGIIALITFASYVIQKIKNNHTEFAFKGAFHDLWQGVKELLR